MKVNVYSRVKQGGLELSRNFKVREFACLDGSDPVFICPELVEVLQDVRDHFKQPVIINSAYRTPTYNSKVGGAKYSQHLYGKAADITVKNTNPAAVATYLENKYPNTYGIGRYPTFTHIDTRALMSRWKG